MSNADELFARFFGSNGPQKGKDIVHRLSTKLDDLYNGKMFRLAVNRNKISKIVKVEGPKVRIEIVPTARVEVLV
jgi:DnaJ-class molecular chaperone